MFCLLFFVVVGLDILLFRTWGGEKPDFHNILFSSRSCYLLCNNIYAVSRCIGAVCIKNWTCANAKTVRDQVKFLVGAGQTGRRCICLTPINLHLYQSTANKNCIQNNMTDLRRTSMSRKKRRISLINSINNTGNIINIKNVITNYRH